MTVTDTITKFARTCAARNVDQGADLDCHFDNASDANRFATRLEQAVEIGLLDAVVIKSIGGGFHTELVCVEDMKDAGPRKVAVLDACLNHFDPCVNEQCEADRYGYKRVDNQTISATFFVAYFDASPHYASSTSYWHAGHEVVEQTGPGRFEAGGDVHPTLTSAFVAGWHG